MAKKRGLPFPSSLAKLAKGLSPCCKRTGSIFYGTASSTLPRHTFVWRKHKRHTDVEQTKQEEGVHIRKQGNGSGKPPRLKVVDRQKDLRTHVRWHVLLMAFGCWHLCGTSPIAASSVPDWRGRRRHAISSSRG